MTHFPPDDDLPPETPQHDGERQDAQESLQEHAFQSQGLDRGASRREPSGFGFVALVAGLMCLVALSGIVIYSLLLAPTPPRQPILIEAEGTTKQAPADAQVKPEPNNNVGIFRMLRGTDATQQDAKKNTPLIVKPGAPQETNSDGLNDSSDENNAEAEQQQTEKSVKKGEEETETDEKPAPKETSDKKETSSATETKQAPQQETSSASGAWYVQIAALESRAATDKAWAKLHDQLPELLYTQNYVAKAATLASGRRIWRLLLGPQPRQQAETLCRELKTRARSCLVKKIAP